MSDVERGWLERETDEAVRDVSRWPAWMKRAADLDATACRQRAEEV